MRETRCTVAGSDAAASSSALRQSKTRADSSSEGNGRERDTAKSRVNIRPRRESDLGSENRGGEYMRK